MAYWTGRNHHGVLGCVDIHAFGDGLPPPPPDVLPTICTPPPNSSRYCPAAIHGSKEMQMWQEARARNGQGSWQVLRVCEGRKPGADETEEEWWWT